MKTVKMSKEQIFFIKVLSDYLNGRNTELADEMDWGIILQYARRHQVSGIIYHQAKEYMVPEIQEQFRKDMLGTYYYQINRENDIKEIEKALGREKIPYFIVKGPKVAELFPIPRLRVMGDVDLIIHTNDRETCHKLIQQFGYMCVSRREDREWQYYKNRMEIELHDRLVYKETVNGIGHEAFFNDCWKYVYEGELDWSFHLMFLIFHLRKHLMNKGVGFRQFMDLTVVAQKAAINWEWVEERLKETGMLEFAKRCYGFIYKWFSIRTPIMDEPDESFFEEASIKIFEDGVFGFGNIDNEDAALINQVRFKRYPKVEMARIAIRKVFPRYKDLKYVTAYSYLQKYPLLLPCAWIQRFCRGMKKDRWGALLLSIQRSFVENEKIAHRKRILDKWRV